MILLEGSKEQHLFETEINNITYIFIVIFGQFNALIPCWIKYSDQWPLFSI